MNLRIFSVFFSLLIAVGCTVYNQYPIDIYKPGEVIFPPSVEKAVIVSRNFKYSADTLMHFYKDNYSLVKAKNDPDDLDSLLTTICIKELAANLSDNNVFADLHVFPYRTFEKHSGEHLSEFSRGLIEQIASATDADLLISLDTYSSFFSSYPESWDSPETNEVITVAVWSIYNPLKKSLIERKTMIDTIYWNGYDDEGNFRKGFRLPSRLSALEQASAIAGENYAKRFYAGWQTVSRLYSVPPLPEFSEAARYFEEGEWNKAIRLWQKYAGDRNGKTAIHARYNLALAFEMKDDLETAQKWLNAALELATKYRNKEDLKMILKYREILNNRQKETLKLKMLNENFSD